MIECTKERFATTKTETTWLWNSFRSTR